FDKVISSLTQAADYNSSILVAPEVILWPDPEKQWEKVIPILQNKIPSLLIFDDYDPTKKQGPALWLKCMVGKTIPGADWPEDEVLVIYLPGVSKRDLKNVTNDEIGIQPLIEYQYTGVLCLHENGKEWTVPAFLQYEKE